jgi:hypothetical protein
MEGHFIPPEILEIEPGGRTSYNMATVQFIHRVALIIVTVAGPVAERAASCPTGARASGIACCRAAACRLRGHRDACCVPLPSQRCTRPAPSRLHARSA